MKLSPYAYRGWCLAILSLSILPGKYGVKASTVLNAAESHKHGVRERSIPDNIIYDLRPDANNDSLHVLKPWILPSGNDFIRNPDDHHERPSDEPNINIPFINSKFNDSDWDVVRLPHDWAIAGPFYTDEDPVISSDMGRLPVQGVGWYRRKLTVSSEDLERLVFLEVDGAMSYPMVWLNGRLVGGWAYGYNSFHLDLTPYLTPGTQNQLAIRVENPSGRSSRWYPGAGIYRNVWLTKVNPAHVAHWGTYVTASDISSQKAIVDLEVQIANKGDRRKRVHVVTEVFDFDPKQNRHGRKVAQFPQKAIDLGPDSKDLVSVSTTVKNPRLWGPLPIQSPNLYVAVTRLYEKGQLLDTYETQFGIRSLAFDPNNGLLVNGIPLRIQGVNQHHDLGALGAAFNTRAAQRQLDMLRDLGVNAIRMAHNPPAPELLEMTDRMGFLKTDSDFHLIFQDWREPDLRSFMRRDRNHPSVIQESMDEKAAAIASYLRNIVVQEDPTRPSTASMHRAAPNSSFAEVVDIVSLNYIGEGVRYGPAYEHVQGTRRTPQYEGFHEAFPNKLIFGSEVAWSLSTRGSFLFPVTNYTTSPINDTFGGNSSSFEISAYELYSSDAGSSPDRVFATQDERPFVAGGFVWAGWDYLGEPYPYAARSAYSGIIDLAGFKKERFYLYQSRWRPDLQMAHILPHWTWPDRVGQITPVHVFTSGDEAELFLNAVSQGRKRREPLTYRFRWDAVVYEPGQLHVVAYKDGKEWATDTVQTIGNATGLRLNADHIQIAGDGEGLSFVTLEVIDATENIVPEANNLIRFSIFGPGEIIATDNGFPADFTAFPSHERQAFNGLALCIVRAEVGASGSITVRAESDSLKAAEITLTTW
ncbi:glycoside hydrolase superfamily [Aspergillus cavernicola]|uniref:Glycoside hydrolase superfamily n=1 Tax=Aspergillus cavernicola TaxID=176166 RepID=A0ABR4HNG9_9EURO